MPFQKKNIQIKKWRVKLALSLLEIPIRRVYERIFVVYERVSVDYRRISLFYRRNDKKLLITASISNIICIKPQKRPSKSSIELSKGLITSYRLFPVCVERAFHIYTLIRVCTEIIALGL